MKSSLNLYCSVMGFIGFLSNCELAHALDTLSSAKESEYSTLGDNIKFRRLTAATESPAISVIAEDQAGGSDLSSRLSHLAAAGLIEKMEVRVSISDIIRLASSANDCLLDGEHSKAFEYFDLLAALNSKDHMARFQLANYLLYGIKGSLEPRISDRKKACQLLIEACWLELTEHRDEPDNAGRLVKALAPDIYASLSEATKTRRAPEYDVQQNLQDQFFSQIQDILSDPF